MTDVLFLRFPFFFPLRWIIRLRFIFPPWFVSPPFCASSSHFVLLRDSTSNRGEAKKSGRRGRRGRGGHRSNPSSWCFRAFQLPELLLLDNIRCCIQLQVLSRVSPIKWKQRGLASYTSEIFICSQPHTHIHSPSWILLLQRLVIRSGNDARKNTENKSNNNNQSKPNQSTLGSIRWW